MAMHMRGIFHGEKGRTSLSYRTYKLHKTLLINDRELSQKLRQVNLDLCEKSKDEIYGLQQTIDNLQEEVRSLQHCNWTLQQQLEQKSNPVHINKDQELESQDQKLAYSLKMRDKDSEIENLHMDRIKQNDEMDAARLVIDREKNKNRELKLKIIDLQKKLDKQEKDNITSNRHDEEIIPQGKKLEIYQERLYERKSLKPLENEQKISTEDKEEQNRLINELTTTSHNLANANEKIHKLQAEIAALKIDLLSKKDEATNFEHETKQLSKQNNVLHEQLHDFSEESLYKEKEREQNMHQLKERYDSVMLDNESLKTESQELKSQLQKLNDDSETLRSELHLVKEHNENFKRKIATMTEEHDRYKTRFKSETVEQTQKMNNMRALHEEAIQYKTNVDALTAENKLLENQTQKTNTKLKEIEQESNNHKRHIATLKRENETLKEELETRAYSQRQPEGFTTQNAKLTHELEKTRRELLEVRHDLEDAKTRLSKVMGQKLTDNNPNIADLSDKNRPTKLAERYSELYDNQWTDAFDVVNKQLHDEKSTIDSLSNILLSAADFCQLESETQMTALKELLFQKRAGSTFPSLVQKNLKDCRKALGDQTGAALYEKYIDKMASQHPKPLQLQVKPFVKECIELCWLMSIQDPPVVIGPKVEHGTRFDMDFYKAYTKSGPLVDFVVWPALCLHVKGALLCKGIAQGYGSKLRKCRRLVKTISKFVRDKLKKLQTENLLLNKDIDELKESNENDAEQLRKFKEAKTQLKQLKSEKEALQRNLEYLNKQLHELKQQQETEKDYKGFGVRPNREVNLQEQLDESKTHIREIRQELEETKLRLSKAMGRRLTDGNSDIADLSDKNRPTKLGEQYSELYDNQWTDAYDFFEKLAMSDEETIELLLKILRDAYDFCQKASEKQMKRIKNAMFMKDIESVCEMPSLQLKQYKECRKEVGEESGKAVLEDYIECLKLKRYKWEAEKALKILPYVKECIQLCWLMCLQDPPVVFDKHRTRGEDFNSDIYRACTKTGQKIAFLVWPAMLLYKDGNVLCKGVAQCFDPKKQDYHEHKRNRKEAWPEANDRNSKEFHGTDNTPKYRRPSFRNNESSTHKTGSATLARPQSAERTASSSRITDEDMKWFLHYRKKYWNDLKMAKILFGKDKYERCYAHLLQK